TAYLGRPRCRPGLLQRFVRPGSRPLPGGAVRPADCLAVLGEFADEALLPVSLQNDELPGLGDPPGRQLPLLVDQEQDAPLREDGARLVLLAVVQPLTGQTDFLVRLGGACEATQREQAPRISHGLHHVPPLQLLGHRAPLSERGNGSRRRDTGINHRRQRTKRLPLPRERRAVTRIPCGVVRAPSRTTSPVQTAYAAGLRLPEPRHSLRSPLRPPLQARPRLR